jgi:hypothetical protein
MWMGWMDWMAEAVPQLTQSWIPTRTFLSIYNTKCQLLLLRITYAFAGRTNFFSADAELM